MLDDYLEDEDVEKGVLEEEKINLLLTQEAYYDQAQKIYDFFTSYTFSIGIPSLLYPTVLQSKS